MENRIKECQADLFADRTSAATFRANQLRLWLASMAYVLLCALRRIGLRHTGFAEATCGTLRLKLLKIGAIVKTSVRRISIAMASGYPWQAEWNLAQARLRHAAACRPTLPPQPKTYALLETLNSNRSLREDGARPAASTTHLNPARRVSIATR